jgi:NTE family protein
MRTHLKDITFEELPIPFAAIATDINTGREVVLRHGRLWEALRSSGSVPVMFEPFYLDGRYLVDGGLTNPLPTDILIENDVDFVISCSVNSVSSLSTQYDDDRDVSQRTASAHEQSAPKSNIIRTLTRTLGIMSATNTMNKARLADVDIRPDVSYIDWSDFHRGDDLLREGERAAEKAIPAILELLRAGRN